MRSRIVLCFGLLFLLGAALPASAHVTEHCTVGFYKNHTQFLNNGTCTKFVFNKDTLVSTLFPDVDSCVGAFTLEGLLDASSSACGPASSIAGGEIIMLRQAIARLANAANSTPPSCDAVNATVRISNHWIDIAASTDNRDVLIILSQQFDTLNQGSCTLQ